MPESFTTDMAKDTLRIHFNSPSMLAIFPIQDIFAAFDDLRTQEDKLHSAMINIPKDGRAHVWKYRLNIDVSELLNNKQLIEYIRELTRNSGRI